MLCKADSACYYKGIWGMPKESLIICGPKIEALSKNFEAVKLMMGG